MTLHIAMACDEAYAPHAAAAIASAVAHGGADPVVHLFHDGLAPATAAGLTATAATGGSTLRLHGVGTDGLADLKIGGYVSLVTYVRLTIPERLDGITDRVLYLDSDLVVRRPLAPLWSVDMGGAPAAAVVNGAANTHAGCLGLPADTPYYNSGVLLIDIAAWQRHRLAERALDYARRNREHLRHWDQDAINAVAAPLMHTLPARWNLQRSHLKRPAPAGGFGLARAALADPAIIHFTGPHKPWSGPDWHPWRHLYWHWRGRTPWARPYRPAARERLLGAVLAGAPTAYAAGLQLRPHLRRALRRIGGGR